MPSLPTSLFGLALAGLVAAQDPTVTVFLMFDNRRDLDDGIEDVTWSGSIVAAVSFRVSV
jgi:hypothetical protein